jgi:tRNA A-37 threonylcarbamoyl transferase component Bud32
MSLEATCPQCHAPLPPDAPVGLCPRCLIRSAAGLGEAPAGDVDFPDIGDAADVARRLPQFEILSLLGRGGMGVVYKARQPQLDRIVALKILPPADALSPDFVERFRREARALAKLSHPNIVHVYEYGEQGGLYFFVMEFVDGANLRTLLQSKSLTPAEALGIVPQVCDALEYAHEEGIVHRDIKPENILIDKKGRLKIADFGLAKLLRREAMDVSLTVSGTSLGTVRYMAPEQMEKPETVDHRADIYSLGVVLYEMLTGEVPMGRFAPPSEKVQVDVKLDEIVLHALERDVERRYQHASEVKTALERVSFAGAVPQAPASGVPTENVQTLLPRLMVTALAMLIGGLTMAIGVALAVFAVLSESPQSGQFWGWMGGAFGCFFGGGGALIGAINSYRQLAGAGDLMTAAGSNWLDRLLAVYAVLGAAALVTAFAWGSPGSPGRYSLLLLGALIVAQAAWFRLLRHANRRPSLPIQSSKD